MAVDPEPSDRLNTWKEIASYLDKDIRTVMRWQDRGLPVHRVPGGKRQAIFAYRHEIDRWLDGGVAVSGISEPRALQSDEGRSPSGLVLRDRRARHYLAAATFLGLVLIASLSLRKAAPPPQTLNLRQLTTDGAQKSGLLAAAGRLYFSELRNGRFSLFNMPAGGGSVEPIDSPPGNSLPVDVSKDGESLLVIASAGHEHEAELWLASVHGSPRRVGDVKCHSASWLSDGKTIVYASGRTLYKTSDEGNTHQTLRSFQQIPESLSAVSRRNSVVFMLCGTLNNACSAWELPLSKAADGVTANPEPIAIENCCKTWSKPDGQGRIVGTAFPVAGALQSTVQNLAEIRLDLAAGGRPIWVSTRLAELGGIALDSAGRSLYVNGYTRRSSDLLRFSPATGSFTPFLAGISAHYVDFSRDGLWVAYVRASDQTLWVSNADGSNPHQLFGGTDDIELPRWSPDSHEIAFLTKPRGRPWRIFVVPRSGGAAHELTSDNENQGAPTWSPDGKYVVFANVNCEEAKTCSIHKAEVSTGHVEGLAGSAGLRTARWSPNGRYVAALDPARQEVRLFDFLSGRWKTIATGVNGDDLSWSFDSRYLFANRDTGEQPGIVQISVATRATRTIIDLAGIAKMSGMLMPWFCVAPDGSLLIERNLDSTDIYTADLQTRN